MIYIVAVYAGGALLLLYIGTMLRLVNRPRGSVISHRGLRLGAQLQLAALIWPVWILRVTWTHGLPAIGRTIGQTFRIALQRDPKD